MGPSSAGRKEFGEGRGWWKMFSLCAWQAVASPSSGEQVLPATRVLGSPPFCPAQWASPEPLPQTWTMATVAIPLSVMTSLGREGGLRALPALLTPAIGAWHTPSPASPPECRQQPLFPLYSAAQSRDAEPGGLWSCLEPCSRALGNEGNQSHFLSAQAAPGAWPNIARTIRWNSAAALHCRPATLPLHRWGSGGPGRGHPPRKSHGWEAVNFRWSTGPSRVYDSPVLPPADLDSSWVWHPRAESRSPESEVQGGVKNTGATVLPGLWSPLGCSGGLPAPEFCCSNRGLG